VAAAIAYSFIPVTFSEGPGPIPVTTTTPSATATTMKEAVNQLMIVIQDISNQVLQCLQARLCGIDFKYSIVDSGTGRELQNQFIHNIAGLGKADGDRPFRPFAKPMIFLPRSTIRITVEEISVGAIYQGAELYIVLHGYKILGYGTGMS
jgi:hypothetical protein